MEQQNSVEGTSFFGRLGTAFRLAFDAGFAARVASGLKALENQKPAAPAPAAAPKPLPPERAHASALLLLSALQREGRLVDFLQQEVASFSDDEVGAAARVVHAGCRKSLQQYFTFEPAVPQAEGEPMTVAAGFDAQRVRLTGNVTGQPPFRGTLKHHGWVAKEIRMPAVSEAVDPRTVAPAEVELP
jgi:hypothetical protein